MKKGFFLVLFGLFLGCSACSQVDSTPRPTHSMDAVESRLIAAANTVSSSITELAAIESANTPPSALPKPRNPAELGMSAHASINWTGPVEPLVRKLASASNYKVNVLGHRPAMPTIVAVRAKDADIASILRDTQFQAQKAAEIVVYPNVKIIELRYLGN